MSEEKTEKNVEIVIPAGKKIPESKEIDLPTSPLKNESPIKVGYSIGVRENGKIVFNIVGTEQSFVELLGLHHVAALRLDEIFHYNVKSSS